jgi:MIP family channel proteins
MSVNYRACLAEFLGTFALVFFGTLAIATGGSITAVALTHGLVIAIMIYSVGHISGAHFNPAVTIAMLYRKTIDMQTGIAYMLTQLTAGVIAAIAHASLFPTGSKVNFGSNLPAPGVSDLNILILEILLTFFLVFVVFSTAVSKKTPVGWHGFAIGLIITVDIFAGGPITGASMNPARSFGPAIVSYFSGLDNALQSHHLYWIAPILGGLLAAYVEKILNNDK